MAVAESRFQTIVLLERDNRPPLVSRFRSSPHLAARSHANFGIERTLASIETSVVWIESPCEEVPQQWQGLQIHHTSRAYHMSSQSPMS